MPRKSYKTKRKATRKSRKRSVKTGGAGAVPGEFNLKVITI